MRPAIYGDSRDAVRAGRHVRWPSFRSARIASTSTSSRAIGGFTPRRRPVRNVARACGVLSTRTAIVQHGEAALRAAVACLREGKIVALRGLGGYQLLVDATNQTAVERLRARKGRRAQAAGSDGRVDRSGRANRLL